MFGGTKEFSSSDSTIFEVKAGKKSKILKHRKKKLNDSSSPAAATINTQRLHELPNVKKESSMLPTAPQEKHQSSNEIRIHAVQSSLKKKQETASLQQEIISASLIGDASIQLNKKIRFSDEDSDDPLSDSTEILHHTSSASDAVEKSNKRKLFDEQESASENDISDGFQVASQYRGAAGEKLRMLESKFGGDRRFKMDERFLEASSNTEERLDDEDFMLAEKKSQLRILENVVGKHINSKLARDQKETKKNKFQVGASVRFDPERPEHYRYKLEKQKVSGSDSDDEQQETTEGMNGEAQQDGSSDPENSEASSSRYRIQKKSGEDSPKDARFYHMDADFAKQLFEKQQHPESSSAFSLLASLGKAESHTESSVIDARKIVTERDLKPWQTELLHPKTESSMDPVKELSVSEEGTPQGEKQKRNSFFFFPDDPEVVQAVKKFCRTQSMDVVKKKWEIYRDSLVKSYKRQRKQALWKKKQKQKQWDRLHGKASS